MATIFERVEKHFKNDLKNAEKKGYKKGYNDAMNMRFAEINRGKPMYEKLKIALQLL